MSLDDTLSDIVRRSNGIAADNILQELHQAFKDEQYCWQGFPPNAHLQSGAEWYNKFEKEIQAYGTGNRLKMVGLNYIAAAKRAAGLTPDE